MRTLQCLKKSVTITSVCCRTNKCYWQYDWPRYWIKRGLRPGIFYASTARIDKHIFVNCLRWQIFIDKCELGRSKREKIIRFGAVKKNWAIQYIYESSLSITSCCGILCKYLFSVVRKESAWFILDWSVVNKGANWCLVTVRHFSVRSDV